MQGYEHIVLNAAPDALAHTKYLYTEVSKDDLYEGMTIHNDYIQFLTDKGFEVIKEEYDGPDGNVLLKNKAW